MPDEGWGEYVFVYLDESGDCGFKFNQGSTRYFIVGMVLTEDPDSITKLVNSYRTSLGYGDQHEFKFYKSDRQRRAQFLEIASRMPIRIRLLIIDKTLMTRPHMQRRETFYGYVLKMMLENSFGAIRGATLVIDRSDKSKKNQQSLSKYIKQACTGKGRTAEIEEVKHFDSRSHAGIQVADMIAGAAMAAYRDSNREFLEIVRSRIDDEWEWKPYANI